MEFTVTRVSGAVAAATLAAPAMAQDNSVTIVLPAELEMVEPCMASQSNIGRVLMHNISETLTYHHPDEGLQPALASNWKEVDQGTWRFDLQEGVQFHDRADLTASDVAHPIERTLGDQIVCEIGAKFFGGFELETEIIDENTIDVTRTRRSRSFRS